jgi:hypothetical protein
MIISQGILQIIQAAENDIINNNLFEFIDLISNAHRAKL